MENMQSDPKPTADAVSPSPSQRLLARQASVMETISKGMHEVQQVANQLYAGPTLESAAPGKVVVTASVAEESSPAVVDPPWLKSLKAFLNKPKTPAQTIAQDKLTFCLGLVNLMLTAFLFGFPRMFIRLFVLKSFVLLGCRWLVYRTKNWHYFLLEFCYVAICLGMVQCTLFTGSPGFHKLVVALMAGVLTGAVVATRNAFVLHSVDKLTSLFQHMTPALVAWLMRWQTRHVVPGYEQLSEEQKAAFSSAGFVQLTVAPMGVWLVWALAYYALVFVVAEKKVRERKYATMFALQTKSPKSPLYKFIFQFKDKHLQYAAYMLFHGGCCTVGMLLNNLWFHSYVLHTAFVLFVLGSSIWNGATYNFDVFAPRYMQSIGAVPKADAPAKDAKTS